MSAAPVASSQSERDAAVVPPIVRGLVDDAAVFPPGDAAPDDAVAEHVRRRATWYAPLVGGFVFPSTRIEELRRAVGGHDGEPLCLLLTVPGGTETVGEAVAAAQSVPHVELGEVQVPLRGERLERDAKELCSRLEEVLAAGVRARVEIPLRADWREALDALGTTECQVKLRTGGVVREAFPSARALAEAVVACVERSLNVKCTAGLHRALAHGDPATGFEYHGFVNVLLAVHEARRAASPDAVAQVLTDRSEAQMRSALAQLRSADVEGIRETFVSFGSCSIQEPLADLGALGVLGGGGT